MHPYIPPTFRSLDEQLMIDISAFLYGSDGRVILTDLQSSFPTVDRRRLLDALEELEDRRRDQSFRLPLHLIWKGVVIDSSSNPQDKEPAGVSLRRFFP